MGRLRAAMTSRYKDRDEDVKIHTPRNLETLNLSFRGERVAKVRWFYCFELSYHDLTRILSRLSELWQTNLLKRMMLCLGCWSRKITLILF